MWVWQTSRINKWPLKIHLCKCNRCISHQRLPLSITKHFGMIAKWLDIHVFMFNLEKGDWYLSIENLFSSKLVTLTNLFRRQHFTLLLLFKTQKMTMVLHQGLTFARHTVGFSSIGDNWRHDRDIQELQRDRFPQECVVSTIFFFNLYIWIVSLLICIIVNDLVFVDISYYLFHFFCFGNMFCILIKIKIVVSFHYFFKNANKFKTWQVDCWSLKKLQITQIGWK